ncbi:SDR family oxidoreductase [Salimicrobium jeotgali]|uniref:SDR family oxidoreductase n=1 Tax=Salimicrobium jeotgali TaxID=1230341 RepID=UPI000C82461D|nr:SDR family oxidoreductase [Salimicrobium jeotgali]
MKKVLVAGANGQIGKHLVRLLQESEQFEAKAMIRDKTQASFFENLGAGVAVADLEDEIDVLAALMDDVDAVVFAAGSGPHTGKDKTIMIDLDGAVKMMEAAKQKGVSRFALISSFDTRRGSWGSEEFRPYAACKFYADEWLRASGLEYTIIHPGRLTNDEGTGKVNAGEEVERDEVPREDVAKVIVETLNSPHLIKKEFQVTKGEAPVMEALKTV